MKNECSIVRDLLPLYAEGMLSEDSAWDTSCLKASISFV